MQPELSHIFLEFLKITTDGCALTELPIRSIFCLINPCFCQLAFELLDELQFFPDFLLKDLSSPLSSDFPDSLIFYFFL